MKAEEEETARIKAEEEEAARLKAEEEEAARIKAEEEEAARIKAEEEEARLKAVAEEQPILIDISAEEANVEKMAKKRKLPPSNVPFVTLDTAKDMAKSVKYAISPDERVLNKQSYRPLESAFAFSVKTIMSGALTAATAVEVLVDTITDDGVSDEVKKTISKEKENDPLKSAVGSVGSVANIAGSLGKAAVSADSTKRLMASASETSRNFMTAVTAFGLYGKDTADDIQASLEEMQRIREEEAKRRLEEQKRQRELAEAKRLEEERLKAEALRIEEEKRLEALRIEEEKRLEAIRLEEEKRLEAIRLEEERKQQEVMDAMSREVEAKQIEIAKEVAKIKQKYIEQLVKLGGDPELINRKLEEWKEYEAFDFYMDMNDGEEEVFDEEVKQEVEKRLYFLNSKTPQPPKIPSPPKDSLSKDDSNLFFAS